VFADEKLRGGNGARRDDVFSGWSRKWGRGSKTVKGSGGWGGRPVTWAIGGARIARVLFEVNKGGARVCGTIEVSLTLQWSKVPLR